MTAAPHRLYTYAAPQEQCSCSVYRCAHCFHPCAHCCAAVTAAGQAAGERSIFDFSVRQYGKQTSLDAYKGKVRPTALPLRMSPAEWTATCVLRICLTLSAASADQAFAAAVGFATDHAAAGRWLGTVKCRYGRPSETW